jgi:hypothetical protein
VKIAVAFWALVAPVALYAVQETPSLSAPEAVAPLPMDLDGLIQITDSSKCDFGEEFNQIGERLFVIDPAAKKIKPGIIAFPEKYSAAFGKPEFQDQEDGTLVLTMPMVGNLRGFPLVAIVTSANASGKPAKTMFVLKTDYATAEKRLTSDLGLDIKSAFSLGRIPDVTDYITLNCEKK